MSEQTGLLIKAVRKRPVLFDSSHEHYKNILKKAEAWDEIASELNLSSDMVKVKWKNLRDSYIRHKKSIQNIKGQDRKYVKWPWSTQMMFLDNYSARGKAPAPRTMTLREGRTTAVTPSNEGISGLKSLKIPLPNQTLADCNIPMEVFQDKSGSPPQTYDAVDHLFLSYAETFKKFRPHTQAVIKLQLATLFSRTELNELQEKDVNASKVMISPPCEGRTFIMRNNGASTSKAASP